MKKTIISSLAVVTFLFGCEESKLVDDVFDDTRSGAVLRTLSTDLEVDLFDRTTDISIEVEQQDESLGQNFQNMDIFISFTDNNFETIVDENGDPVLDADGNMQFIGRDDVAESLLTTIPASSFGTSDNGLPSFTYTATFEQLIADLGLVEGSFTGGDVINVRLLARLNDGSEWSVAQANNNITGGAYFSSPFQYAVNIVCAVDPTFFIGDYQVTYQGSQGGFGDLFNLGGSTGTLTLEEGPSSTARQFTVDYNGFGFDLTFVLDFVCENVASRPNDLGAGCGGSITTDGNPTPFDISDDSSFTLEVVEADDGGCAPITAGNVVTLNFTKL